MDKAITKVNQNELDWCENFSQHSFSVSKNYDQLFPDCTFLSEIQVNYDLHLGRDVCVNFIKTIFQIFHNDVIDNMNNFKLATVFASIKCL